MNLIFKRRVYCGLQLSFIDGPKFKPKFYLKILHWCEDSAQRLQSQQNIGWTKVKMCWFGSGKWFLLGILVHSLVASQNVLVWLRKIQHSYWCKSWNQPRGLDTRSRGCKIKKNFSICPKLLINAELYGLVLAPKAEKRIPSNLGGPVCNPKMLKVGPKFFLALTPSVKRP